ncbi:hypothetical protein PHYPO_G00064650 [Pangasianodon hypophthalmus]|uniref:CR032 protein n=1 Tax=Pangasianodon hypophthalmus TaxID=310915 RepID=A0A5N5M287_PANHP|nr:UPF0729 protein C18orf32 homolog [Pangasianodon hypophthalmus]KAB5549200.1 hypothetical protein PHYPO_G00064650 [Pangasianodon hypophthalmus]
MVCIPCIVIPILLWVYKRFLEPIVYPLISPFISRFWTKKAVQETGTNDTKANQTNQPSKTECNGNANVCTANGTTAVSDKKKD